MYLNLFTQRANIRRNSSQSHFHELQEVLSPLMINFQGLLSVSNLLSHLKIKFRELIKSSENHGLVSHQIRRKRLRRASFCFMFVKVSYEYAYANARTPKHTHTHTHVHTIQYTYMYTYTTHSISTYILVSGMDDTNSLIIHMSRCCSATHRDTCQQC